MDIVKALDVDTDTRVRLGLTDFPEPVNMMTKRTRQIHLKFQKDKKVCL